MNFASEWYIFCIVGRGYIRAWRKLGSEATRGCWARHSTRAPASFFFFFFLSSGGWGKIKL